MSMGILFHLIPYLSAFRAVSLYTLWVFEKAPMGFYGFGFGSPFKATEAYEFIAIKLDLLGNCGERH